MHIKSILSIIIMCLAPLSAVAQANAMAERENAYVSGLKTTEPAQKPEKWKLNRKKLVPTETDGIFYITGKVHQIPDIKRDVYVKRTDSTGYSLVFDSKYPIETLSNMVVLPNRMPTSPSIKIKFNLYGNKKEYVTVTLCQLLNHALARHETPYLGMEKQTEANVEATIFLVNNEAGYEHVVFMRFPSDGITNPELVIEGEAYLYAPTGQGAEMSSDLQSQ